MPDSDVVRSAFARELDALVSGSPFSAARVAAAARRHGIGYSTVQSWRTGVHLPRVPEDNPAFGAFLREIAADRDHAARVVELAKRSWRGVVRAKRRRPADTPRLASGADVESAYLCAGDDARRTLAQLTASRCRALSEQAATAMTGRPSRPALDELTAAGLLTRRPGERYAVPDLVRAVVGDRLGTGERRDAEKRLACFHARGAIDAARRLFPDLVELAPPPNAVPVRFPTDEAASAWLAAERDNLAATVEAVIGRDDTTAAPFLEALRVVQQVRPHAEDWTPLAEAARRGAEDHAAIAGAEYAGGVLWWGAGHPAIAVQLFTTAARRWSRLRRPREQAAALHMLGAVHHARGNCQDARRCTEQALRLRRRTGERVAQASTLVFLAGAYLDLGRPAAAAHHAGAAAELAATTGYTAGTVGALGILGRALLAQGHHQEAESRFREQQAMSDGLTFHSRTAVALVGRALVCNHRRHYDTAVDLATEAASAAAVAGNVIAEVDAYNAAATGHRGRGRLTQAESLHRKALHVAAHAHYRQGHHEAATALAGLHPVERVRRG